MKNQLTLKQLDKKIKLIENKIEKERQNVIDSGFNEGSDEFWNIFAEIKSEYIKEIAIILHQRHKIQPFDDEKREVYNIWLSLSDCDELGKG